MTTACPHDCYPIAFLTVSSELYLVAMLPFYYEVASAHHEIATPLARNDNHFRHQVFHPGCIIP